MKLLAGVGPHRSSSLGLLFRCRFSPPATPKARLQTGLLGELGDDLDRFDNLRNIRAFSGTSPVTKQSGGSISIRRRHIKNNRVAHASFMWAFALLKASPGVRDHYDRRRAAATSTPQRSGTWPTD